MTNLSTLRPNPPALPTSRGDLVRKTMSRQTLNDHVETCVLALWDNETFQSFIDAVYNEQAVEGSLHADDIKAAEMIRDQGVKDNNPFVAEQKLAVLAKVLNNVVLRRYGVSRNERRQRIGSSDAACAA